MCRWNTHVAHIFMGQDPQMKSCSFGEILILSSSYDSFCGQKKQFHGELGELPHSQVCMGRPSPRLSELRLQPPTHGASWRLHCQGFQAEGGGESNHCARCIYIHYRHYIYIHVCIYIYMFTYIYILFVYLCIHREDHGRKQLRTLFDEPSN